MITFILNDKLIETNAHPGTTLLDFIRYGQQLPGTKIGCREGDCGACTVLEGSVSDENLNYKSIVSCLTPLGNAQGKHIVTIEGINMEHLSPVQDAMVEHSATQCGFCTPGFVMALTGHSLAKEKSDKEKAIAAISGNICRCTGYKSIEKAAETISGMLEYKDIENPVGFLVENKFLPSYFETIGDRLKKISNENTKPASNAKIIGGGTDLMVQRPEEIAETDINLFYDKIDLKGIKIEGDKIVIGAGTSPTELMKSDIFATHFPKVKTQFKLISSEPIRNMSTVAGNFVNASPIGDLSIFFLSLNAKLVIKNETESRTIDLNKFFLGYKKFDLNPGEYIESILIPISKENFKYNFEKVSKRTHLDIASVNSAISMIVKNDTIETCSVAAGGVSAVPKYLQKCSEYLTGKEINAENIKKAETLLQSEIAPIGDVRGTEEYKRLLVRQLFFAHFIELFPDKISLPELTN